MLYKKEGSSNDFINQIHDKGFQNTAFQIFNTQYNNNSLYKSFADGVGLPPSDSMLLTEIPFLPISFFKTHTVLPDACIKPQLVFESSGTTGSANSKHYVVDVLAYEQSFINGFTHFYGNPSEYTILALLPSYLERNSSSLVYMARKLMDISGKKDNGFYLNEHSNLAYAIKSLEAGKEKTLLLGVTFALLDFAEAYPMKLEHTIIMETGGMKGRREEWTRAQVHDFFKTKWDIKNVHSEYGMTELFSQAYSKGSGIFYPAQTMKVLVRDINDPLEVKETGTGCLNIIDLANIHSCSFIATDDIGTVYPDGSFEVLGRVDHSALRGCNLMVV